MVLGIIVMLLPCVIAVSIGIIANRNAREIDDSSHESFFG